MRPHAARWRLFDCHLHIIDPRFPLVANQGFVPDPFTVADYRLRTADLAVPGGVAVAGGAVVSGSFQGTDQTYLLDALHRLGPGFVGVTQLPTTVGDEQLRTLHAAGVRAIRINLVRGGPGGLDGLTALAHRAHRLVGWHTELYLDSADLPELEPVLGRLPQISIDHLGLSRDGFPALLRLAERGATVKASGFGRVDLDVPAALRELGATNPHALMFGTDLPGTRAPRAFRDGDIETLIDTLGEQHAQLALHDNAHALYRPATTRPP